MFPYQTVSVGLDWSLQMGEEGQTWPRKACWIYKNLLKNRAIKMFWGNWQSTNTLGFKINLKVVLLPLKNWTLTCGRKANDPLKTQARINSSRKSGMGFRSAVLHQGCEPQCQGPCAPHQGFGIRQTSSSVDASSTESLEACHCGFIPFVQLESSSRDVF